MMNSSRFLLIRRIVIPARGDPWKAVLAVFNGVASCDGGIPRRTASSSVPLAVGDLGQGKEQVHPQ
jgi:hypothetical protein